MTEVIKSHTLKTIREEFNDYILEDNNTLRVKDVLVGFAFTEKIKKDKDGKTIVESLVQFQQINGIIPTGSTSDSNSEFIGTHIISKEDRKERIEFKPKNELISIYETDEHMIFVKNMVNGVWKTKFKDKNNVPIYSFESKTSVETRPKKDIAPFT